MTYGDSGCALSHSLARVEMARSALDGDLGLGPVQQIVTLPREHGPGAGEHEMWRAVAHKDGSALGVESGISRSIDSDPAALDLGRFAHHHLRGHAFAAVAALLPRRATAGRCVADARRIGRVAVCSQLPPPAKQF